MIMLMGVAGSGKSTQGRLLADKKGYAWLSSGEILRVLVTGTRRQEMLKGKLLNDIEMIKIFDKVFELINPADEFVLDGFPRTLKQAHWLMDQVKAYRLDLTAIFHFKASDQVVKERLLSRGRQDDTDEAITKRFDEYKHVTLPILEWFKEMGATIYDIDASKDAETIHVEIMSLLNVKR